MNAQIGQSKGFTLVETLIAAAILSLGILSVATMVGRSTIQDSRAYLTTHASMMAEEFFENQARMQFGEEEFKNMTGALMTKTIAGVDYEMDCILANNTPMENAKEMTCTVTWNNKGIPARTRYVYVYTEKW